MSRAQVLADLDARRLLCDMPVTLDGHPAIVAGVRNEFATVKRLDGRSSHQLAWATVRRIIRTRGGRFLS